VIADTRASSRIGFQTGRNHRVRRVCRGGDRFATARRCDGNEGAQAWLTWSPSGVQSDLPVPGATNNLYGPRAGRGVVQGAEIDLAWHVPSDGSCAAPHTSDLYPRRPTGTVHDRGITLRSCRADDPGHIHIAWANTTTNTICGAGGNIVVLQFAYDACTDSSTLLLAERLELVGCRERDRPSRRSRRRQRCAVVMRSVPRRSAARVHAVSRRP